MAQHEPEELEDMPTLSSSMGDELKIDGDGDDDGLRVWLEPHSKRVSYERLVGGRWRGVVFGGVECSVYGVQVVAVTPRGSR